jgi:surfactin family lipopeptide synthetase A
VSTPPPPAGSGWSAAEIVDAVRERDRSRRAPVPVRSPVRPADAPAGSPEAIALSIVAGALGREAVDLDLTFAMNGGDSLAALQILARVWRALNIRLPLSSLAPDVELRAFLRTLEAERGLEVTQENAPARPAAPRRPDGPQPLTPGQIAIWLSSDLGAGDEAAVATIPVGLRLRGVLDIEALRASLGALVTRHEALSLSIREGPRGFEQVHRPVGPLGLPVVDAGDDQMALAREHAQTAIDPAEPPLLRPLLLRIGPADHLLVLAIHHIACDAWSVRVLLRELSSLYDARVTGEPCRLADQVVGYSDFAGGQLEFPAERMEHLVSFWRSELVPILSERWLPTDLVRPERRSGKGATERLSVRSSLLADLRGFSAEQGVTVYMTLLAAYSLTLTGLSGRTDLIVGSPMANRLNPLFADTVGYLSNTVPIRLDLDGGPTVRELLGRVRRASLAAYDHQDLPLPNLISALGPPRDLAVPPIFQVCFVLNEMPASAMHGLDVERVILHNGASIYDLTLYFEECGDSLRGYLEYPTDLFQPESVRRLRNGLMELLRGMIDCPDVSTTRLLAERVGEGR